MTETLASLAAAAALLGAPSVPAPTPRSVPAPASAKAAETVVTRLPLAALAAAQSGAFVPRPFGGATLEAAIAFDAKADGWLKFRSGAWTAVYSESALKAGVAANLPSGPATLTLDADGRTVTAAAASGARTAFDENELMDALYAAATRVTLDIVTYAALYEDGASAPASLCLLRRDQAGNYFVTYRALPEMAATQWFLGANMRLYGMKIAGPALVFVSEPVPPAGKLRR